MYEFNSDTVKLELIEGWCFVTSMMYNCDGDYNGNNLYNI